MKKVIIYARVSTSNQDTQSQLLKLKEFCKNHNYEIVEILEDIWSWKNTKRENYQILIDKIHKKSFDILLVWKLDRLSRSLKDLIDIWEKLNHKSIDLVTYDNSIDTTTPWGKMMFQILWVFAEFQRALITQNIKAWLQKAKQKWIKCGRPVSSHKTYNTKLLTKAFKLKKEWLSYRKIADELNIKDHSTLYIKMKEFKK